MKITNFPNIRIPTQAAWQKLHWGTRTVVILTGCVLAFALLKKIATLFTSKPSAPTSEISEPSPNASTQETSIEQTSSLPKRSPPANPKLAGQIHQNGRYIAQKFLNAWKCGDSAPNKPVQKYLNECLFITTSEDFSRNLNIALEGVPKNFTDRGITSADDLKHLGLLSVSEKFSQISRIYYEEAPSTIEGQSVISFYKQEEGGNTLIKIQDLKGVNGEIKEIIEALKNLISCLNKNYNAIKALQDTYIETDLPLSFGTITQSLSDLETSCLTASNRPGPLKKNIDSLYQLIAEIHTINRQYEICLLRWYILQSNITTFWQNQQREHAVTSLSQYTNIFLEERNPQEKLEALFQLYEAT